MFFKVSDFVTLASTSKCVWSPSHVALFIVETPDFAEKHISLLKKKKKEAEVLLNKSLQTSQLLHNSCVQEKKPKNFMSIFVNDLMSFAS